MFRPAGRRRPAGVREPAGRDGLHEVICHVEVKRFCCVLLFGGRKYYNGSFLFEVTCQFNAGHSRHFNIQQYQVDVVLIQKIISLHGIHRFAHYGQPFYGRCQLLKRGPGYFIVIDDQTIHSVYSGFNLMNHGVTNANFCHAVTRCVFLSSFLFFL